MNRKTGVILSYILMIFEILNTLLLTPFMIRTLGQAEFGVYKLIIAINGYLLLLDLGIGNATIKYISKYRVNNDRENERKFLGVVTIYYIAIAIITLIIGFIITAVFPYAFAKGLSVNEIELGQKLIFVTMITTAIALGTSAFNNVIVSYEKFGVSKGSQIFAIIIRISVSFLVLKLGFGSFGLVLVNLFMTIAIRLYFVLYVLFKIKLRPKFKNINKKFIKEIIFYSTWILLQMIATQLNASVDQILIGSLVASSSIVLAIYGVGSQITQYFQQIGSAFTGVLMPGVVKVVESKPNSSQMTNEMVRIGRYILMVLILIWGVFLILGKEFIYLWAGNENIDAYMVAIILMSAHMFTLTKAIGAQMLWAMNEHKEQAILKFIVVLINLILTIFLIKWKPLLGATIGTFISLLIGDIIVMDVIFHKKLGINIKEYYLKLFKGILPCIILTIIVGFIMNKFISSYNIINFIIKSVCMTGVYSMLMYLFGLNKDEKKLIMSILNIKRRLKHEKE